MTAIEISVPYTESQLSADCVEEFFEEGEQLEVFLSWMYSEGYNMEVFED